MSIIKVTAIAFCCWSALHTAEAQQVPPEPPPGPDVSVGEISFSSFRWGPQQAVFELTNTAADLKFITVEATVGFTGHYLNPTRWTLNHHILEPLESKIIRQEVPIPGNFGQAKITIELLDVVDTLDRILPGQKFFELQNLPEYQ